MISGVININKGKGYTSFHVVAALRHFTGEKKIGHTGTLDPDATGVLPVCLGRATKLVGMLTDTDKRYRACMVLGRRTDTQDISGNTIGSMDEAEVRKAFDREKILRAFDSFTGEIMQVPPMFSALKVDGVKLVNAARKGREIERSARKVSVYGFSEIEIDPDALEISFTVDCSKGTYIRTICEDIGNTIGIPACLKTLERTRTSGLDISDSVSLEDACSAAREGRIDELIIPTDRFLADHDYLVVTEEAVRRLVFGNILYHEDICRNTELSAVPGKPGTSDAGGIYRIYDWKGEFYALYRYFPDEGYYKCSKMFK